MEFPLSYFEGMLKHRSEYLTNELVYNNWVWLLTEQHYVKLIFLIPSVINKGYFCPCVL